MCCFCGGGIAALQNTNKASSTMMILSYWGNYGSEAKVIV